MSTENIKELKSYIYNRPGDRVYKDDIGVVFRVYAGMDLSSADTITMKVKKADGVESSWTASVDDTNTYYAKYTTVSGDLSIEGTWQLSLEVTEGTSSFTGQTAVFDVYKQFED